MQQVESAMMETNILVDASNINGKQSSLYATYSNEKSSSLKELYELSKSLQYEIEILQKMVQDTDAKLIVEKKAREEEERSIKEKKAKEEAKLETEKKLKEAEEKKVTIVKSSTGAVFGGYTSISWNSHSTFLYDPKAFLFSIHGPQTRNRFKKFKIQIPEYAIFNRNDYHPTFGNGNDIFLGNKETNGYHYLNAYTSPDNEFLDVAHPTRFTTIDYEVYMV